MADLYTVTVPLRVQCRDGSRRVALACVPHARGVVLVEPPAVPGAWPEAMQLLEGELKGEGPWKVGECVITVLGCHGTDGELATEFAQWRQSYEMSGEPLPSREQLIQFAAQRFGD